MLCGHRLMVRRNRLCARDTHFTIEIDVNMLYIDGTSMYIIFIDYLGYKKGQFCKEGKGRQITQRFELIFIWGIIEWMFIHHSSSIKIMSMEMVFFFNSRNTFLV